MQIGYIDTSKRIQYRRDPITGNLQYRYVWESDDLGGFFSSAWKEIKRTGKKLESKILRPFIKKVLPIVVNIIPGWGQLASAAIYGAVGARAAYKAKKATKKSFVTVRSAVIKEINSIIAAEKIIIPSAAKTSMAEKFVKGTWSEDRLIDEIKKYRKPVVPKKSVQIVIKRKPVVPPKPVLKPAPGSSIQRWTGSPQTMYAGTQVPIPLPVNYPTSFAPPFQAPIQQPMYLPERQGFGEGLDFKKLALPIGIGAGALVLFMVLRR